MLMFISFPAIIAEWVASDSLAYSSRNDVLSDKYMSNIAKPVAGVKRILKKLPGFAKLSALGTGVWGSLGTLSLVPRLLVCGGIGEVCIHRCQITKNALARLKFE